MLHSGSHWQTHAIFFTKCLKVSKDWKASPLLHFSTSPLGTSVAFQRRQLCGPPDQSLLSTIEIKTTGRSGFPIWTGQELRVKDFIQNLLLQLQLYVIISKSQKNQMLSQIPEMALYAGKQSLPKPWVMILEVEGRLDGRQVIWGGFSNLVRHESHGE